MSEIATLVARQLNTTPELLAASQRLHEWRFGDAPPCVLPPGCYIPPPRGWFEMVGRHHVCISCLWAMQHIMGAP